MYKDMLVTHLFSYSTCPKICILTWPNKTIPILFNTFPPSAIS